MKKLVILALGATLCTVAHAQLTIYNGLNPANVNNGYGDWDGGANDFGANYGDQTGQLVTNTVGATSITGVEAQYIGFDASSGATGVLVQVYNFSGGVAGSLVGQQQVTGQNEVDTGSGFADFQGYTEYDLTASVNITGLVSGNQYLVVMQGQGGNWGYIGANTGDGNSNIYARNYSGSGYAGAFGANWAGIDTYGYTQGDLDMKITGAATPEPASLAFLGLGLVGVLARRRRRA